MLLKSKKAAYFLFFLLTAIVLSGCWDHRDIEMNAFILGVGIDSAEDDKMEVTFEIALPQSFVGGGGGGESSGDVEPTLDISMIVEDMTEATNNLLARLDLYPEYTHLQLLVFGEEYARKGIQPVMDYFFRNPNIRYRTTVAVTAGKAKKLLSFKPQTTKSTSMLINQIIQQNAQINLEIFELQNIGTIYQNYIRNSPVFLPKITLKEQTVDVSGGGVFRNQKLVEWFTGEDVRGMRWLWEDPGKGGIIRIEMPENKGGKVALNVFHTKSSLIPELEGDKITVKSKIYIEGDVISIGGRGINQPIDTLILEWEKAFEEHIHECVHDTFIKGRDVMELMFLKLMERWLVIILNIGKKMQADGMKFLKQ